ncbi:tetratricopeptide repeat protein [Pseudoalteromonas sp. SR41-8]|uniref:COG3014 family protein n=1 Tax=Pseudoalteromonas sp. SR41-8 TaxID=2760946 RepID=UPI0016019D82|nr:tetratricopeptide repeat protein [Pseudoalteromonas sp. SR41-8]MBB1308288.1 tetratricopeptide repeat protein [Pseudoalteromonas sp. SR41-8]
MQRSVIFGFCVMLSGCSTIGFSDLFSDYATQMTPVRQAIKTNNIGQAQQLLPTNGQSHSNYLLNQLEQARLSNLNNQNEAARPQYEAVYQQMEIKRQAAKIQVSAGLEQSNALFTNDSVISYTPAAYEMSMLHSYQALNYIYQHNIEGALVEVRRANKVQTDALTANQDDIDASVKAAQKHYPSMDEVIKNVKNGYQNAFTFYLSGLLYQSNKQYDDAYIDYKKALEINPENTYLQQVVLQLAKQQGFDQDFAEYKKRLAELPKQVANSGDVVVLIEQGLVPEKDEFVLRLPINTSGGDARFYSLAMPVYKDRAYIPTVNAISIGTQTLPLSPLVRIEALAAKTLEEQTPARVSRQILRLVAKEKVRAELARSGGDVGNILANLYNLASEQADTRSWLTLPNQISVARTQLTAGDHVLKLANQKDINFTVSKQGLTLIYLTSINNYFNSHVVQL